MQIATAAASRFRPISAERQQDIAEHLCPMRYETSERSTALARASLRCFGVGALGLVHYESQGTEHGARSLEHIRANPADYFLLCLPLQARFEFSQCGRDTRIVAGAALLLTSQRPFDGYVSGDSPRAGHASIHLRIPGALLRSRVPNVDRLCNQSFSVLSGAGLILRSALRDTLQEAGVLSERQAQRQALILADLLANCLDPIDEAGDVAGTLQSSVSVFERANAFIDSRLSDPDLDVGSIARHCHVSTRYLHKLFAQRSLNLAAQVRERRLQSCRAALRDARLVQRSVIDIASDWGFRSPSHFGRVYKERFGISPRADRPARTSMPVL